MADFDNFESASGQQEEDPAAEFLAREQNQMAGLEDDFGTAEPAPAAGIYVEILCGQTHSNLSHPFRNIWILATINLNK